MRLTLVPLLLALAACAPGGSFSGTIVDGFTGQPRGDLRVIAKTEAATDMTCAAKEATTDASGNFSIPKLCADNDYNLTVNDESLMLEGAPVVDGGAKTLGVQIKAWRAPNGDGIYVLSNDELSMVRTFSDIKYEVKIDDPSMKVAYPEMKPTGKVRTVNPGDYFAISGKSNVDRLQWRPLLADTGKRTFVDGSIADHVWVGVKFTSDTEWEKMEVSVDPSKIKVVTAGDRIVHYIPHDALPEGRYALYGESDKRMFIVDMGRSFAPEAPAGGDAPAGGEATGG